MSETITLAPFTDIQPAHVLPFYYDNQLVICDSGIAMRSILNVPDDVLDAFQLQFDEYRKMAATYKTRREQYLFELRDKLAKFAPSLFNKIGFRKARTSHKKVLEKFCDAIGDTIPKHYDRGFSAGTFNTTTKQNPELGKSHSPCPLPKTFKEVKKAMADVLGAEKMAVDLNEKVNFAWVAEAVRLGIAQEPNWRDAVEEELCEEYRAKHFVEGETVDFGECDTCNTWTVGERRCDCGNRRVNIGFWRYGPFPADFNMSVEAW